MSSLDVLVVLVCMASLAGNGAALCVHVDNTTCECASDDCDVIRNNFQNFQAALKILQNCTSNVTDICEITRDERTFRLDLKIKGTLIHISVYKLFHNQTRRSRGDLNYSPGEDQMKIMKIQHRMVYTCFEKNPEGAVLSKTCPLKVYFICMNNTDKLTQTNCNVTSPETFSKGNGPKVGQENAQCQPLTPEVGPQSLPVTSSTNTTSFPASPSPTPLSFLAPGMPQHLMLTVMSIILGSVCLMLIVALIVACMKLKRQRKGLQRGEITQSDMEVFDNQALYSGVISGDGNDDKTYMTIE